MAYTHVLFDLDHTLLDTEASLRMAFADAMRVAGFDADPASGDRYRVFDEINKDLWRRVEHGELTPARVHVRRFEELVDRLDLPVSPAALAVAFAAGMGANGDLYPDARSTLESLAGRVELAMVTNGVSEIQRARIDRLDIGGFFRHITVSGEVDVAKPDPAIFDLTLSMLGDPDRGAVLMVGDNLHSDIGGGFNAGIDTCWYNPDGAAIGSARAPTHHVTTLEDVVTVALG